MLVFLGRRHHGSGIPEPAVLDRRHRDRARDRRPVLRGQPSSPPDGVELDASGDERAAQQRADREQAAPIEHDLERAEHLRVVEVLRRRAQRLEREPRRGRCDRPTARRTRSRPSGSGPTSPTGASPHVVPVRNPLGGDDVAGGSEELGAPQDRPRRSARWPTPVRRAAVVGLVDAHLAEVVQQGRGLELLELVPREAERAANGDGRVSATRSACPSRTMPPSSGAAPSARIVWSYVRRIDVEVLVRVPRRQQRDREHDRTPQAHAAAARRHPRSLTAMSIALVTSATSAIRPCAEIAEVRSRTIRAISAITSGATRGGEQREQDLAARSTATPSASTMPWYTSTAARPSTKRSDEERQADLRPTPAPSGPGRSASSATSEDERGVRNRRLRGPARP